MARKKLSSAAPSTVIPQRVFISSRLIALIRIPNDIATRVERAVMRILGERDNIVYHSTRKGGYMNSFYQLKLSKEEVAKLRSLLIRMLNSKMSKMNT